MSWQGCRALSGSQSYNKCNFCHYPELYNTKSLLLLSWFNVIMCLYSYLPWCSDLFFMTMLLKATIADIIIARITNFYLRLISLNQVNTIIPLIREWSQIFHWTLWWIFCKLLGPLSTYDVFEYLLELNLLKCQIIELHFHH